PRAQRLLGRPLQADVDRGVDLEAELIWRGAAVALLQEPADVLDVPGRGEIGRRPARREDELLGERGIVLLGGDEILLAHALQDVVLARRRLGRAALRIVATRRLGEAREEGRLRDR